MKSNFVKRGASALLAAAVTASVSAALPVTASAEVSGDTKTFLQNMGAGWILGNSLDSVGTGLGAETFWGNPKTTKEMIDAVHDAGFNTIRIPVSWGKHTSGSEYTIDSAWMARVKEVVNYAYEDGMYVILNIHHDNSNAKDKTIYYYPDSKHKEASLKFLTSVWSQVSEEFKDYNDHLIFETLNEPRLVGTNDEWWIDPNNPNAAAADSIATINTFNQEIVDTIRASGGNNSQRYIMCPGYSASLNGAVAVGYKLPDDTADNKLLVSVHAYNPYNLCLGDNSNITSPTYTQFDDSGKKELDNIFSTLNNKYMSKGIGVVIGEMGISYKNNNEAREQWASYYYGLSKKYTVPCVLWDNNAKNGSQKSENHWHLNRKNCKWGDPNVIQAIMNAMGVTNVSIPADDDVVEKKTQTISGTKTYTKTYGDKAFALNAKTVSGGGALSYKSSNEKVVTVDGKGNVTVKGAGTAKITVTASENAAYKSATMEVTVKVNAQQLTNAVIQPIADQVYGGSAVKPKVTVKQGAKVIGSSNYYLTYTDNNKVGTATAIVKFKGNYKGQISANFNITLKTPAAVNKVSATTAKTHIYWEAVPGADGYKVYRYNSKTKKWKTAATLRSGIVSDYVDSKLKAGEKYAYKVKAFAKSDGKTYWSGAVKIYAATKPAKVSIKSVSASKTSIRPIWKSTKCSGYEVYILKNGKYTLAGTASASDTSFKITGLKSKTTYKVKVRAYVTDKAGRSYKGTFSAAKSVKTK